MEDYNSYSSGNSGDEDTLPNLATSSSESGSQCSKNQDEPKPPPPMSRSEAGKLWWSTSTETQRIARLERMNETVRARREKRMATMSEPERKRQELQYARDDRKSLRKKLQVKALRRLAGWEHASDRDLPKARMAGIKIPYSLSELGCAQNARR